MHAMVRRAATACCLSLLVLLAGCGGAATAETHPATPAPTVDPVTSAYLSVLQSYYAPFTTAETLEFYRCFVRFGVATKAQKPQLLAPCRPLETAASATVQATLTHLATTSPPGSWKKANAELNQALEAMLPYYAARIDAIDANSITQFEDAYASYGNQAFALFCDPVAQFNLRPPAISPPLQAPYANICHSGEA